MFFICRISLILTFAKIEVDAIFSYVCMEISINSGHVLPNIKYALPLFMFEYE